MEVFEAVRTVLAIRAYQDKPVPSDVVRQIVEAGRLTGSAGNKQPWHFIVVDDRGLLSQLSTAAPTGHYITQAPLAVVVAIEPTQFAISDASRAIQSMILTAWENGLGSNWVGFLELPGIKSLVGLPDNLDVLAVIPFGYPVAAQQRQGKKKRKSLSEVASRGHFGQAFE